MKMNKFYIEFTVSVQQKVIQIGYINIYIFNYLGTELDSGGTKKQEIYSRI